MKRILNFFKRLLRLPAAFFVRLWANREWKRGVRAAENRARRERKIIYLAKNTFHPDRLVTYCRSQFRMEKHIYGWHARLLTMTTLKRGCYYYTADRFGQNGMSEREKERRRKAFVKERLRAAKLI